RRMAPSTSRRRRSTATRPPRRRYSTSVAGASSPWTAARTRRRSSTAPAHKLRSSRATKRLRSTPSRRRSLAARDDCNNRGGRSGRARSRGAVEHPPQPAESARVQLRHPRLAHAELGADVLELDSLEVVHAHDAPLAVGELLDGPHESPMLRARL